MGFERAEARFSGSAAILHVSKFFERRPSPTADFPPAFSKHMSNEKPTQPTAEQASMSAEERLADLRRRRTEAADVIAETLLDLWLADRRARREPCAKGGRDV